MRGIISVIAFVVFVGTLILTILLLIAQPYSGIAAIPGAVSVVSLITAYLTRRRNGNQQQYRGDNRPPRRGSTGKT